MNRRDFIKSSGFIAAASALPGVALADSSDAGWVSINAMVRANAAFRMELLHSMMAYDLVRKETPREKWKRLHRVARMEIRGIARKSTASGESGSISGFRFITTEALP